MMINLSPLFLAKSRAEASCTRSDLLMKLFNQTRKWRNWQISAHSNNPIPSKTWCVRFVKIWGFSKCTKTRTRQVLSLETVKLWSFAYCNCNWSNCTRTRTAKCCLLGQGQGFGSKRTEWYNWPFVFLMHQFNIFFQNLVKWKYQESNWNVGISWLWTSNSPPKKFCVHTKSWLNRSQLLTQYNLENGPWVIKSPLSYSQHQLIGEDS